MDCQNRPQPFDTIESAQEFMALLAQSICQTACDIEEELSSARNEQVTRRAEALELTIFKLNQLRSHVGKAEKLLKELRTLHGLLCKDVKTARSTRQAKVPDAIEALGIG
jgi:hypothetical protein